MVAAAAVCLASGAAATGCSGSAATDERSAGQLLDDAYRTMKSLKSVTVDGDVRSAGGKRSANHLTTDLRATCTFKSSSESGAALEQIRIEGTDYIRPNRAYLEQWSGRKTPSAAEPGRWIKKPSSESVPGDGLSDCTWPFTAFGRAKKSGAASVDGRRAIALVVTDEKVENGTYTLYVAAEGKPYLLEVDYKGTDFHTTTTFSAFDEPLEVKPPAEDELLDLSGTDG
ncbi:hypothetical protein ACFCYX_35515 [Streptomyces populi]|uniref:hypothetical protein n=1 Tax=Streptomyces populi TaxID=2058924 RepID=UPI001F0C10B8|nr:hypothetical protein [Streptomyces populi]